MGNFKLTFFDRVDETRMECEHIDNTIQISIRDKHHFTIIELDKSTAIKFAKTIRTEINKIKEVNCD